MFYIKAEIAEGITIKAEITDENVFTTCPGCGTEHQVDLQDAFFHGELDLCGTAVYCAECSKHRAGEAPRSGERELHFEKWEPSEKDYRQLLTYFREYYEGSRDNCGADDDTTIEAEALYEKVKRMSLRCVKGDIQEHFADVFHCVGGEIEKYYDKSPETIRLINLTVSPDPLEEA